MDACFFVLDCGCKLVQPTWRRSFKGLAYSGYLAVRAGSRGGIRDQLTSFEAGVLRAFARSPGPLRSARVLAWGVQIFDNLVGREVEVMLLRSVPARKGGGGA